MLHSKCKTLTVVEQISLSLNNLVLLVFPEKRPASVSEPPNTGCSSPSPALVSSSELLLTQRRSWRSRGFPKPEEKQRSQESSTVTHRDHTVAMMRNNEHDKTVACHQNLLKNYSLWDKSGCEYDMVLYSKRIQPLLPNQPQTST